MFLSLFWTQHLQIFFLIIWDILIWHNWKVCYGKYTQCTFTRNWCCVESILFVCLFAGRAIYKSMHRFHQSHGHQFSFVKFKWIEFDGNLVWNRPLLKRKPLNLHINKLNFCAARFFTQFFEIEQRYTDFIEYQLQANESMILFMGWKQAGTGIN